MAKIQRNDIKMTISSKFKNLLTDNDGMKKGLIITLASIGLLGAGYGGYRLYAHPKVDLTTEDVREMNIFNKQYNQPISNNNGTLVSLYITNSRRGKQLVNAFKQKDLHNDKTVYNIYNINDPNGGEAAGKQLQLKNNYIRVIKDNQILSLIHI